jgi:hypothetical protein
LLDFVRRDHSTILVPSPLILSFNSTSAVWRYILPKNQHSLRERAQSIQVTSALTTLEPLKIQDH